MGTELQTLNLFMLFSYSVTNGGAFFLYGVQVFFTENHFRQIEASIKLSNRFMWTLFGIWILNNLKPRLLTLNAETNKMTVSKVGCNVI